MQGSGCRVLVSGFRVQGSGFRVQGAGFRVQGSGCARLDAPLGGVLGRGDDSELRVHVRLPPKGS